MMWTTLTYYYSITWKDVTWVAYYKCEICRTLTSYCYTIKTVYILYPHIYTKLCAQYRHNTHKWMERFDYNDNDVQYGFWDFYNLISFFISYANLWDNLSASMMMYNLIKSNELDDSRRIWALKNTLNGHFIAF